MINYNEIFKFLIQVFTLVIPLALVFVISDRLVKIIKDFISGGRL